MPEQAGSREMLLKGHMRADETPSTDMKNQSPVRFSLDRTSRDPVKKAELLKLTAACPSFASCTIYWEFLGYFSQFTALWRDTD